LLRMVRGPGSRGGGWGKLEKKECRSVWGGQKKEQFVINAEKGRGGKQHAGLEGKKREGKKGEIESFGGERGKKEQGGNV